MESADHRTHEDSPIHPSRDAPSDLSDDDLSFSNSRPPPPAFPAVSEETPAYAAPAVSEAEPAEEEPENEPAPVGEDDFEPEALAPEQSSEEDEGIDDEFAEEHLPDFEEEDEGPVRRRSHRDDRGGPRGRGRGRDQGRRPFGRPDAGRPKPLIQDIFKRGQEVLVQVIKEGIGTKGPTLSTYISIAGRYLVLMPGLNRIGVSRKIDDDEQRRRLREILSELKPPGPRLHHPHRRPGPRPRRNCSATWPTCRGSGRWSSAASRR